jgi:hypothetical protein
MNIIESISTIRVSPKLFKIIVMLANVQSCVAIEMERIRRIKNDYIQELIDWTRKCVIASCSSLGITTIRMTAWFRATLIKEQALRMTP